MGKLRRGNYVLITWRGDHSPYHVHVYRDRKLIVKWDLENNLPMRGSITARIRKIIEELRSEGAL